MILLPWYFFAIACMTSFAIAWVLLSLLTSGKIDDLNSAIAVARKESAEWKTLAELYHDALHKQSDKIHAEKLAEIEASEQKDDYIDWSKIPDGYDWVAVQPSGSKICFEYEPYLNDEKDWFIEPTPGGALSFVYNDAIIGPLPPWRESLRKRPGK